MTPFMFTVSPDFSPNHLSGWYFFNTWLQKQTDTAIHFEMFDNFQSQRKAIQNNEIDLIYANPFDAAMLVREKGFLPLVKVQGESDEAIIAVNDKSSITDISQLHEGIKVAYTHDPDVHMMGMIMLESGDLSENNITPVLSDTYVLVAKNLINEEAEVGIFLAEAYDKFSSMVKNKLRVLVRGQISVVHHSLLMGPKLLDKKEQFQKILIEMHHDEKGLGVLESLDFKAWEKIEVDEMEFMIDLMDTLNT